MIGTVPNRELAWETYPERLNFSIRRRLIFLRCIKRLDRNGFCDRELPNLAPNSDIQLPDYFAYLRLLKDLAFC